MHIRHKLGAYCADAEVVTQARHKEEIVWAKVPFKCAAGRLVAVRERGSVIEVAAAGPNRLTWAPLSSVLSEKQARHWVRTGF